MKNNYLTIAKTGEHEIEIKKSRFICQMARATSEEGAADFIAAIKKKQYKATHNCSAYLIGENNEHQRANDDGEPSGTAGVPMLESLKLMQLQNVVAVTTRYFGGIKLGAGGLIRAYSNSVTEAAHAIGIVRGVLQQALRLTIDYNQVDPVQHFFSERPFPIEKTDYGVQVTFTVHIDVTAIADYEAALTDLTNGRITLARGAEEFREVPYTDKAAPRYEN
ncbi:YigZ family protein [Schleiferilactobacillus shenzhenensis]|uniref:YvyE n=1 Tax=Schleiferilactobacillus shenzhenensis LY-73 TaxID=1231336 RepID=U4TMS4_9LACO|nr:YigZ family protein [Schleiferilactobacillus shenzhenensis]ERL66186.1 YvyE [Schleiferilactobacillus shenzhenensis LY-73]